MFIASGIGGFGTIERRARALSTAGRAKISPFFIPSAIINLAAGQVSIRFGARGPESVDLHRVLGRRRTPSATRYEIISAATPT